MTAKKKKPKRWVPTVGAALGPQEQKLVDALKGGDARPVSLLFTRLLGLQARKEADARQMQQRIGAVVSRLNKKLKGRRVVAGDQPRTYRLRRVR